MRWLTYALLTLLAVAGVALLARDDPGYVLIAMHGWTVETTATFLAVVTLIAFALTYVLIRLWSRFWGLPQQWALWRRNRRIRHAQRALSQGLLDLTEGRWASAEKQVLRHAADTFDPALSYLVAARAALAQGASERCNDYLRLARTHQPAAATAVGLTEAEIRLEQGRAEQARAILQQLHQETPRQTHVLRGLVRACTALRDWPGLITLLPLLRQRKAMGDAEWRALEKTVYLGYVTDAGKDARRVQQVWSLVPRELQGNPDVLRAYVERLCAAGATDLSESLLRMLLSRQWDGPLVRFYGRVNGDAPTQLAAAESWLPAHRSDPDLLLTLGRLCMREKLWGKARSYLEASLGVKPDAEAYLELGSVMEHFGDPAAAMACYRDGLRLTPGCGMETPPPFRPTSSGRFTATGARRTRPG